MTRGRTRLPYPCAIELLSVALGTQTLRVLARQYGVSTHTISNWRERLGITYHGTRPVDNAPKLGNKALTWPRIREAMRAYPGAAPTAVLARSLSVSRSAVNIKLHQLERCGLVRGFHRGVRQRCVGWCLED